MLLCFYQSQLGLCSDPVFCSHWKEKTLIWLPCWSKSCGPDVEGRFPHSKPLSPVSLLILGQISARPQICPCDSGKGWNGSSREWSPGSDSPDTVAGLGPPPSLPSRPQCKGWTGLGGPLTFLSSNIAPSVFSASDTCWKSVAILVSYLHFRILPPRAQRTVNYL